MNEHDVAADSGDCKTTRSPFFPFYTDDWGGGTMGFTFEQEGFYLRFVRCQWARKGDLPDNLKWLAGALGCDPRTLRRLRKFLLDEGKLVASGGVIWNPRMKREIEAKLAKDRAKIGAKSGEDRAKIGAKSGEDRPQLTPKKSEKPTKSTQGPSCENSPEPEPQPKPVPDSNGEVESESSVAGAAAPPDRVDWDAVQKQLLDAANGALARDAISLNVNDLSFPRMWLEQGCDLERDVLPTIRSVCSRKHARGIRSWKYFHEAVADAKAIRLAGLPATVIQHPGSRSKTDKIEASRSLIKELDNEIADEEMAA